LKFWILSIVC
jgi:inner membrane protein